LCRKNLAVIRDTEKLLLAALLVLTALWLYSLWLRPPTVDGAWLTEHAYWLSERGYVKSDLMAGMTRQGERLLLHHKLFTGVNAAVIGVFGVSLYPLKSVALLSFLLFVWVFYRFAVRERGLLSRAEFLLALLVLGTHRHIFEHSFTIRPELLLMLLGFLSYVFCERSRQDAWKKASLWALASGAMAGLCVLTHLNGSLFVAAGGGLLLLERRWRALLLFGLGAGLVSSLYLWDFTQEYNLAFWKMQLQQNPYHKLPLGLQLLKNLVQEHLRFFHSLYEISFTLLLLPALFWGGKTLWKAHRGLVLYTAGGLIFLACMSLSKTTKYLIPCLPFLVLLGVLGWRELLQKQVWRIAGILLLGSFVATHLWSNAHVAVQKSELRAAAQLLDAHLPAERSGLQLLAPLEYVFVALGEVQRLKGDLSCVEFARADSRFRGTGFLEWAAEDGLDYLILSSSMREVLELPDSLLEASPLPYRLVGRADELRVLQRQ
jgi:hypothetical protein